MSVAKVLLVEDDAALRQSLAQWLSLNEFSVQQTSSGKEALRALASHSHDVIISDVRMKGMSGLDLLDQVKKDWPEIPVIMLSGHGDVPMAVAAMQAGAFTFLTKPYVPEQLVLTLRNAIERSQIRHRLAELELRSDTASLLDQRLLGTGASMQRLKSTIARIADYPVDVLIKGETGTGKEVVARLLHDCSKRRDKPYVAINCAALPTDIIESEMFGHEAGAFTGASAPRLGKFEFANGGTVFLDEIESMPLAMQAKLLRVLQERSVTRLGSNRELPVDIRVLAATKESLAELAAQGAFREDLYYRLIGAEILIPPLRERGHDLVLLFDHFSRGMAERLSRPIAPLTPKETEAILAYAWPGNVRQLKFLAERRALDLDWRPDEATVVASPSSAKSMTERVDRYELTLIEEALAATGGKTNAAADLLGIPARTLNEKYRRLTKRLQS